ncbi:MAG: 3-hydroxyacyl-ACP dehydratase [Bacteroidetes bacterium]|nr:3-hydroxyacyl-ACP dehydratase [Bacteroidota bacterium]
MSAGLLTVVSLVHENHHIKAVLHINADHPVLKGHFPGHPVVPGASMLQVVKEVLEDALSAPLQLKKSNQLKFMNLVDPTKTTEVQLEIDYRTREDGIHANAKLSDSDTVCFKVQGVFAKV